MMKHQWIAIFSFVALTVPLAQAQTAVDTASPILEKANRLYDQGNCEDATRLFRSFRDQRPIKPEDRDLASFRIAYCAYTAGDFETARDEFANLLARRPDEDEARLRYAETLFALERFEDSVANALKVEDESFYPAARILAARGYLEIQRADLALNALKEALDKDKTLDPVVEFWRGLAHFQMFNEGSAEQSFRHAIRASPTELWTKSASQNWLETLSDSRRPVHARLGVAYGADSNLAQVTYRESAAGGPLSKYYVYDTYQAYDASISAKPIRAGKVAMVPSVSAFVQNYSQSANSSYNPQSYTADLTATYAPNYRMTYRGSLTYTDSKYNWQTYQDYLTANLSTIYGLSKHSTAHFSLGVTEIVNRTSAWIYNPSIGAEGDTSEFYWLASLGYSIASGETANFVVNSSVATLASGIVASNYTSLVGSAGIGRVLPWSLDFLLKGTATQTKYAQENIPTGTAYSSSPRSDMILQVQATLSKTIIERRMTFTASYSYSNTTSSGFQGMEYSNGVSPDYNIWRYLASAYLSYGF